MARSVDVLGDRTSRLDEAIHQLFGRNKCPHHTDVDVMGGGGAGKRGCLAWLLSNLLNDPKYSGVKCPFIKNNYYQILKTVSSTDIINLMFMNSRTFVIELTYLIQFHSDDRNS